VVQINKTSMKNLLFSALLLTMCLSSFAGEGKLIRFYENAKVGYKDASGKVVVPAKFYAGSEFFEGFAIIVDNNKRGYLNAKGEIAIPVQYEDAGPFVGGLAKVKISRKVWP